MAETIEARVSRMGERLVKIELRADLLEDCLPRIRHLELGLSELGNKMSRMADDMHDIKADSHHTLKAVEQVSRRINKLFWTGAGVMMAVGIIASFIQVGAAWGSFDALLNDLHTAQTAEETRA
jgi:hypothetical protein